MHTLDVVRDPDRRGAIVDALSVVGELVRAAAGESSSTADLGRPLPPLIVPTCRYVHILATAMRNRMQEEGRAEQLAALIRPARVLQPELQKRPAD